MLIAFFAALFTGRYPRGMFDYVVGVFRWSYRVSALRLPAHRPVPAVLARRRARLPGRHRDRLPRAGRPLAAAGPLAADPPYAIVAALLLQVAGIVAFIGVFVILFTEKLPPGMFNLIVNPLRWQLRASTYHAWMVTRYPPFEWEE